jgi:hypothetical protein
MPFFESVLNIQRRNLKFRIDNLDKWLSNKNKNFVFIGTIGVGKTSAICSLFNLYDGQRPILMTGAGATTICEVEIQYGDTYRLSIDPYSIEELKQIIREFTDTIVGQNNIIDGAPQQLTTELERAVKFMIAPAGMNLVSIDAFLESKKMHLNNNYDDIINEFIRLSNITERTETEFNCPVNEDGKSWLRRLFSDINNGRNENVSLPKKIYITIPGNVYTNKIIDTKGIDARGNYVNDNNQREFLREDLDRYIKNPDNIIIYCSSFNAAPDTDIMNSLTYYIKKDPEIYKRIVVLVLPRFDEPEKVAGVEADLDISEYEQGLNFRKKTVNDILFLNLGNNIFTIYHNQSLPPASKQLYNDNIESIYNFQARLIDKLENEKKDLEFKLRQLQDYILNPEQLALEADVNRNIYNLQEVLRGKNLITNTFVSKFIEYFKLRAPAANTKNAIAVRWGVFNNKNVYFDFEVQIEELLNHFLMVSNIELVLQQHLGITQQIIHEIIPSIYENFSNKISQLNETVTNEMRSLFEENAHNYHFWSTMMSEYGRGQGYTIRYINHFITKINEIQTETYISECFNKHWMSLVDEFIHELR